MTTRMTCIVLLTLTICISAVGQEYEPYDNVARYTDPRTKQSILSTSVKCYSEEKLMAGYRLYFKFHLIKTQLDSRTEYQLQSILRISPEEWPIEDTGYLLVDEKEYPLELIQINPRNTATYSASGMDGDVSVSTSESQLFRIDTRIPEGALSELLPTSELKIVLYSGAYPVTFNIERGNLLNVIELRNARFPKTNG